MSQDPNQVWIEEKAAEKRGRNSKPRSNTGNQNLSTGKLNPLNMNRISTNVLPAPPGTLFGFVSSDILEDVLIDLAKENDQGISCLSEYTGFFKEQKIIGERCVYFISEMIFLLSDVWCQDSSTKYQAVEILDRFMLLRIEELYKSSAEYKKTTDTSEVQSWSSMKADLCNTFLLHLVSCIQIASKLSFYSHIINNNKVLKFLQSVGYKTSKEEILKSEITVLKTLHFHVSLLSPFNYIEMLLEVLGHNGCTLSLKELREMCIMILDLVYLLRNPLYDMLLKASVDLSTPSNLQRTEFVSVKEDKMLLATGVIAASAFILNGESWNQVLDHLNRITGITINSMFDISTAILKHSIENTDLCKQ
ncbi:cyclin N-terminal domain-containing protein 1 [Rhinophrynus dorsalis]